MCVCVCVRVCEHVTDRMIGNTQRQELVNTAFDFAAVTFVFLPLFICSVLHTDHKQDCKTERESKERRRGKKKKKKEKKKNGGPGLKHKSGVEGRVEGNE